MWINCSPNNLERGYHHNFPRSHEKPQGTKREKTELIKYLYTEVSITKKWNIKQVFTKNVLSLEKVIRAKNKEEINYWKMKSSN